MGEEKLHISGWKMVPAVAMGLGLAAMLWLSGCRVHVDKDANGKEKTVQVEIPAGVSENNYLTLRNQGAVGARNAGPGDLLVMIEIKDDDRFERDGDNLVMDLPLSFSQAALGIAYTVPTPYGDERVTIPAGTQGGTILKLRGKGLPKLGRNGRRGLLVRTHVWTPETISEEQIRLFKELAQHEGDPPKRVAGFWAKLKEALGA